MTNDTLTLIPNVRGTKPTITAERTGFGYRLTKTEFKHTFEPSDAHLIDGAFCWLVDGQCRPIDLGICKEYAIDQLPEFDREIQQARYIVYRDQFFAAYREAQAKRPVSDEERFNARAAYGPGVEVVDVISGRRFRT
jgi:hypothetical protein